MDIDKLIDILNEGIYDSSIGNRESLISALTELKGMIGMKNLKKDIVEQVISLIMNKERSDNLCHTILYGPPGTGKTCTARILSKIWASLDYLDSEEIEDVIDELSEQGCAPKGMKTFEFLDKLYKEVSKELSEESRGIDQNMKSISKSVKRLKPSPEKNKLLDLVDNGLNLAEALKEKTETFAIKRKKAEEEKSLFVEATKEEFVSPWVGHTAMKAMKFLRKNVGKVMFIDESYSLINGEKDSHGLEALTCINAFMSKYPRKIIFIFAGYKELIHDTIFHAQPGLKSRFAWSYDVEKYNSDELCSIFIEQLSKKGYLLNFDSKGLFEKISDFPGFGRDSGRLAYFSVISHDVRLFFEKKEGDNIITKKDVEAGLLKFKVNQVIVKPLGPPPISPDNHMYV